MRRRVLLALSALLCSIATLAPLGDNVALAQTKLSFVRPVTSGGEVDRLLKTGQQLELQRRWGEALTFYEEALRQHPADQSLERSFKFSRIHFDLARRYNDSSFQTSLTSLGDQEALSLYAEVLLMIQSHHVDNPDWRAIVDCGTTGFDVALTDPIFVERHLASISSEQVVKFRRDLRAGLAARSIQSRHDAREAVAYAGELARRQIGLSATAVTMEYTCGAANSLDEYSTYLTPDQLNEVYSQIEGNFVGLGVELKAEQNVLTIVRVIPGSPAETAGIRAADQIIAVDGRDLRDMPSEAASNLLQGPEGSLVDITAVSPGRSPRVLKLRRQQVEVPSIEAVEIVDTQRGIGYLKLTCFQKTTSRDLDAALWKLHRSGMRSLVMDLRGNPGGLLTSAVEVVDKFVERGGIVSTRGRSAGEDFNYSAHKAGTWRMPLVVLIDGDSASASEIFAGAIRDHGRGTIVGARSYGKGSVQGIFALNVAQAGIRLTTAKFYSPNGLPFSKVGVTPHITVQEVAKPIGDASAVTSVETEDAILAAGLQVARNPMAKR